MKGLVMAELRAKQRQFPIQFRWVHRLILRATLKTFPGHQVARRKNPLPLQIPFVNPLALHQRDKVTMSKNTAPGIAKSDRAAKEFTAKQSKERGGDDQANQAELAHHFSAISDK